MLGSSGPSSNQQPETLPSPLLPSTFDLSEETQIPKVGRVPPPSGPAPPSGTPAGTSKMGKAGKLERHTHFVEPRAHFPLREIFL